MACPTVKVHDGVLGVTTPVVRGQPLTLSATSGDFGVLEGSVLLVDAADPQNTFPVPPADVVWSTVPNVTSFVTLDPVPPALPPAAGTASPETWLVRITLAGAAAACPDVAIKVSRAAAVMACPSAVQVNDGAAGGPTSPQSTGDVVSLVPTGGTWPGVTGTAVFEAPTTVGGQTLPAGQPYPGTVVLWSPSLVQVTIPPTLPGFTQQAAWKLRVTPAGATTACGPYTVHVAPSFPVPQAQVLPSSPLVRGALVTVVATQGSFLTSGSGGTVTLKRAAGTPREWAVQGALWTAAAVVFTVPGDLPAPAAAGDLDEQWEVHLRPAAAQPWGSVGTIRVLQPAPALLGVPPVVVSEREIVLVATGATPGSQVNFYAGGKRFCTRPNVGPEPALPLPAPFAHLTGLATVVRVQAPTITEAQRAEAYNSNQIRMPVAVELEDRDGEKTVKLDTQLLLPPPSAGFARRTGDVVTVAGLGVSHPELGEVGSNEWLGAEDRAHVVLYPEGFSASDPEVPLMLGTAQLGADYAQPARQGASPSALGHFREAQETKYHPVPPQHVTWREERVDVTLPAGTAGGRLVLFRDDIPSRPVPFARDLCSQTFLSAQLRELFTPRLSTPRVGLGQALGLDVVRNPVTNVLSDLLANHNTSVTFAFKLLVRGATAPAGSLVGMAPTGSIVPGMPLAGRFVPELSPFAVASGTTPTPDVTVPWSVELTATVHNLPLLGDPTAPVGQVCPDVLVPLPAISFLVAALPVPKLALGFDGKWFGPPAPVDDGAAIFLADGGGGVVSRGTSGVASAVSNVITVLNALVANLRAVDSLLPGVLPNANGIDDVLVPSITELGRCALNDEVDVYLQTQGNIGGGLDDDFSSFVLLGGGGTEFSLFEDFNLRGTRVRMKIPPGTWIADLETMHESWSSRTNQPAPNPGDGFGDNADSFSW
ncbi:MAG TPA: hypothetical protein VJT67_07845 [Longimicrobiaceae bacterium]|nr:hypothetical protein [Longimicrobiaceae bacterium]